jgi:hypothetical protein
VKTGIDPFAIFAPPILTLIAIVLGYSQSRRIRGGKPLSSIQRKLMFHMPAFVLGMTYAIMLQDHLAALFHWENAWIAVIVPWGRCWRRSLGRDIDAIRFHDQQALNVTIPRLAVMFKL